MDYLSILLTAAKQAKIAGPLLVAICTHESGLNNVTVLDDNGSASYSLCQIKEETARLMGFRGKAEKLKNPKVSVPYAAKYVAYQVDRYGSDDWIKIVAAYNAGSYKESRHHKGWPFNYKYIRLVQKKLPPDLYYKLTLQKPYKVTSNSLVLK